MDPYKNEMTTPNLKRHLPMKYLGALNTTYFVLIEYKQRKRKENI